MKKILINLLLFLFCTTLTWGQCRVIAHRGYWDTPGAAENSRASLINALQLNIYGSEIDIWLTTDGHLMVNHDEDFKGVVLQQASYEQCKELMLSNGEKMPQLQDLLQIMKDTKSPTKLIIEIKRHKTKQQNEAAARTTLKAVNKYSVADKVEYISFSLDACLEVVKCNPKARVAYLSGNRTPAQLYIDRLTGIDYNLKAIEKNPHWVDEAHGLNMDVDVWIVDKVEDMKRMKALGVDFLTTNKPLEAIEVCKEP
ncbi:MAG: glycerophosphodiester phosphodiesterase [Segatella salivae]